MNSQKGRWVPQNPESTATGYRICRLMTPNARWTTPARDGILDKLELYPEAQFMNEVLGVPCDFGVVPITEEKIYACCEEYALIDLDNPSSRDCCSDLFMCVYWA